MSSSLAPRYPSFFLSLKEGFLVAYTIFFLNLFSLIAYLLVHSPGLPKLLSRGHSLKVNVWWLRKNAHSVNVLCMKHWGTCARPLPSCQPRQIHDGSHGEQQSFRICLELPEATQVSLPGLNAQTARWCPSLSPDEAPKSRITLSLQLHLFKRKKKNLAQTEFYYRLQEGFRVLLGIQDCANSDSDS